MTTDRYLRAAWIWPIAALSLFGACAPAADHPPVIQAGELLWRLGDDLTWAAPDLDDSAWAAIELQALRGQQSVFWFRARFELSPHHGAGSEPIAVRFSAMATCDLYWDGMLLALPGSPGDDAASELPGLIDGHAYLPTPAARAGSHLLAARCSTHHRQIEPTMGFYVVAVGPPLAMAERTRAYSWVAMASLTAKLVAAAYFLALFFVGRRSPTALWLGLLSLTAAGLLIAEAWRPLVGYTYDWHIPRLRIVHALAWGCSAFLVLYFLARFPTPRRRRVAGATLLVSLAIPWLIPAFDARVGATFLLGLVTSLLWGLGAVRRSAPGSMLATASVGLCLTLFAVDPERFLDQGVFLTLDGMIVLLLVGQAVHSRRERDALEAERLRATRLELELVKKSIQPHFLMNTLTALAEWFEREPSVATRVLDALSREIRLLGDLAQQRTVPLAQEIELCRAHLEVMGSRHGGSYRLVTSSIDDRAPCPPGIIHTMVENAVTHGPPPVDDEVRLQLESSRDGDRLCYRLSAPLAENASNAIGRDGTGLRYIRARLAEAFGADFTFTAGPSGALWINDWTVPFAEPPA